MKTLELTLVGIASLGIYGTYVYYLLARDGDPKPSNLWYAIGAGLDEFFFNSGVKPKETIQNAPNKIVQRLNNE
jgi:hypothetical protein